MDFIGEVLYEKKILLKKCPKLNFVIILMKKANGFEWNFNGFYCLDYSAQIGPPPILSTGGSGGLFTKVWCLMA